MLDHIIPLAYLLSASLFVLGIRKLSKVRSAARGNQIAAVGMLLAVVTTLVDIGTVDYRWILGGLVVGGVIGLAASIRVQMTGMPELVALFNGFGGAASTLVALSIILRTLEGQTGSLKMMSLLGGAEIGITSILSLIIGSITFSGSLVAYLKLRGSVRGNHLTGNWVNPANGLLFVAQLAVGTALIFGSWSPTMALILTLVLIAAALKLGVTATLRIGGADMPVVISLLNSLSGVAASMAGFVIGNYLLIISGSLVGAAGLILTQIMCKAMNRTLGSVLFRNFGGASSGGREGYSNVKESSAEEVAMLLEDVESLIIVPGYGLAVAQAQHTTRELANLVEGRGGKVRYAIHPVAGRMPGHMNVLLAEADVPYEQLVEMDAINPEFKTTDLVIVLGANDVVNPAALNDPSSPIYGMPILNVHEARTVIVVKRSLASGFAGIRNDLFDNDNTIMVFGDAKKVLSEIVSELKSV
jgi:NAD(P) transhydrogenase subunit beta